MKLPRGVRRLFRLVRFRSDPEAELDDELDFHFRAAVEDLVARGMDEDAAWREARRRFGNEEAYRRALRRIDRHGTTKRRGGEMMDTVRQHLAFAIRGVRRSPGFTAAVVTILALGVGANAVMFGVIDRLLLSPPQHVRDADRVRHVWVERESFNGNRFLSRSLTYPDYLDLTEVAGLDAVAAYDPREITMGEGPEARQVQAVLASASLFPLLGVSPALGRFYGPGEDRLGANPVAVLSHEFWTRRFGADPGVLGRTLAIGGGRYQVVGVAPAGFTGAELTPVDVWLPMERAQELETGGPGWLDGAFNRNWWWLRVVVRVSDEVAPEVAAQRATAAHLGGRAALVEEGRYDAAAELRLSSVIAGRGLEPRDEVRVARWLAGVSFIVLLIACFNVANLLLARATRWRRELAVRTALGISRRRLLGQLLVESLVLAGLGAAGAWAVARFGGGALHQVLLPDVAFTDTAAQGRLLAFLGVATVLTALLAGLLPALQASRVAVVDALPGGGRTSSGAAGRTRTGLLLAQAALSAVLLVGAGLFVQSLSRAEGTDLGMDARQVAVVRPEWSAGLEGEEREAALDEVARRLERLPQVRSVARTWAIPFQQHYGLGEMRVPGRDSLPEHEAGGPYVNRVGHAYFRTLGLAVLQGRSFEPADDAPGAPPVMVVSRSMARAWWPDGSAVGQCVVVLGPDGEEPPCTTVVGVVEDHRRQDLVEESPHFLYFLNLSHPRLADQTSNAVVARIEGPADETLPVLAREVRAASPLVRFPHVATLFSSVEPQLRSWRLGATMFSVFGLLALVVAALGLYSVLAFDVELRRHELGIRAALGADVGRLVRMVLRRAVVLVGVGAVVGLGVALAGSSLVAPLLFRVSPRSPLIYVGVGAVLLVVAAVAGSVPAWRATRVDPRRALQAE